MLKKCLLKDLTKGFEVNFTMLCNYLGLESAQKCSSSVERFYSVEFLSHYSSKLAGTKDVDEQGHSRRY